MECWVVRDTVRGHWSKWATVVFIVGTLASGNTGSSMGMDAKNLEERTTWKFLKAGTTRARERAGESWI